MGGSKDEIIGLFSRAAATYNAVGPRFFSHFARRLVSWVEVKPGSQVLDVATGTGAVLLEVAPRLGCHGRVVGVDITQAMLERAPEEIHRNAVRNAELRVMDAEHLAFDDDTFD